ncbi:hypothetical protein HOLleu_21085 [Holothuria leucospilota]|uniref:Uncharacterized protein n=1 Tax=Holothuria leucospilota TaxID=206669 RepID=A0A9Q1H6K5_HOLLE|nr:hypothetical protein HOLleu_21085 [Holothuria leucospilota]
MVKKYQGQNQLSSTTRTKIKKTEMPPQEIQEQTIAYLIEENTIQLLLASDVTINIEENLIHETLQADSGQDWQQVFDVLLTVKAKMTTYNGEATKISFLEDQCCNTSIPTAATHFNFHPTSLTLLSLQGILLLHLASFFFFFFFWFFTFIHNCSVESSKTPSNRFLPSHITINLEQNLIHETLQVHGQDWQQVFHALLPLKGEMTTYKGEAIMISLQED